jgi:hypothetical protein
MRLIFGTRMGPLRVGVITDPFHPSRILMPSGSAPPANPIVAAFYIGVMLFFFLLYVVSVTVIK